MLLFARFGSVFISVISAGKLCLSGQLVNGKSGGIEPNWAEKRLSDTDEIALRSSKAGAKISTTYGSDILEDFAILHKEIINGIYPL